MIYITSLNYIYNKLLEILILNWVLMSHIELKDLTLALTFLTF